MAEVHHFTYGAFNPVAACLLAFVGSFLGLLSTGRAREARTRGRRNRWLIIAALAIGGGAVWLMHFTALLGFDVPASPIRYSPVLTMVSLGVSVVTTGIGLMVVGHGRCSATKIVAAGTVTGLGLLAMHHTGIAGLNVSGTIHYRPALVITSGLIAIVAATAALWFTVAVDRLAAIIGASSVLAIALSGMHYTAMAAVRVQLSEVPQYTVAGLRPMLMILPVTLITAATIVGTAVSALQAMTQEEFADEAVVSRRGVHAEDSWSLKQASMATQRRTLDVRPSPRPVRPRPVRPRPVRPRPRRAPAPDPDEMLEPVTGS